MLLRAFLCWAGLFLLSCVICVLLYLNGVLLSVITGLPGLHSPPANSNVTNHGGHGHEIDERSGYRVLIRLTDGAALCLWCGIGAVWRHRPGVFCFSAYHGLHRLPALRLGSWQQEILGISPEIHLQIDVEVHGVEPPSAKLTHITITKPTSEDIFELIWSGRSAVTLSDGRVRRYFVFTSAPWTRPPSRDRKKARVLFCSLTAA